MDTPTAPPARPAPHSYPVQVEGVLDPGLSRWLWLVKWLLAIPHYVILLFLWMAFWVTTVLAFFSILFARRYPRALFDFNVGVMRWSWRVGFYSYSALGTDRYPPFTLADVPDYPAHLEIDYPERLSRGLVLVKWWLLAIPHFLVLGVVMGGASYDTSGADSTPQGGFSLLGILLLIASVALLFTGRYPRGLFDFVLGLDRWGLRVAGYVALMTDRYPPFRLDQGGRDPGAASGPDPTPDPAAHPDQASTAVPSTTAGTSADAPAGTPADAPAGTPAGPPSGHRRGWTLGRVTALVIGSVLVLLALGLGASGGALAIFAVAERGDDGFIMTPRVELSSGSYAIASEDLDLHTDGATDNLPDQLIGDFRFAARPRGEGDVFVGVAAADDVRSYLSGVGHDTLVDLRDDDEPVYRASPGDAPATPPDQETFWVASATGDQDAVLTWEPKDGDWIFVVMNADGTAGVEASVSAGATLPILNALVVVLLILAGLALLIGALLLFLAILAATRHGDTQPPPSPDRTDRTDPEPSQQPPRRNP